MSKTDHFRAAHDDILQVAGELSRLLNPAELEKDGSKARSALSKLIGKLRVHLLMEDMALFPSLEKYNDEKLRAALKKFSAEIGGIREAFDQYTRKWITADTIKSNTTAFINETKAISNALSKRIEEENKELYTMIDALH